MITSPSHSKLYCAKCYDKGIKESVVEMVQLLESQGEEWRCEKHGRIDEAYQIIRRA